MHQESRHHPYGGGPLRHRGQFRHIDRDNPGRDGRGSYARDLRSLTDDKVPAGSAHGDGEFGAASGGKHWQGSAMRRTTTITPSMDGSAGGGNRSQPSKLHSKHPGGLVPIVPTEPGFGYQIAWADTGIRMPRHELDAYGKRIPGPFSPPPSPDSIPVNMPPAQEKLRRQNEEFSMKQKIQQLVTQASTTTPGTYVGKLTKHNNPILPVLPKMKSSIE